MKHEMHLDKVYFNMIKDGIKHIEYRLNDEKRRKIKIGDVIVFENRSNEKESFSVKVSNLKYYKDLYSMYEDSFNVYLKNHYKNVQEVVDDTSYYSSDDIKKYGCVAIYF